MFEIVNKSNLFNIECKLDLNLPITEQIHSEVLSLPISPVMDEWEIKKIVKVINEYNE